MNHFTRRPLAIGSLFSVGLFLVVATFFLLSSREAKAAPAVSDDEHLVTIHDQGAEKVLVTTAGTVQRVLGQAKISVRPDDTVDPMPSTEITAKNYHINIYRAQPVLVIDGNARQFVMSSSQTPRQIAQSGNIPYYDEDTATLSRSDNVLDSDGAGLTMTIHRATKFTLVLYGKVLEARTQAKTVGSMLKGKGIVLAASDTVSVPLTTPVTADMRVEVWRNGKQTINQEEPVPFPIQQIQNADQPVGYRVIQTPGTLGKKNVTYEVEMQNGQELSRRVIQEVVIEQPKVQVEVVGTKPNFSGDFAAALAKLRSCEGGYTSVNPAGYYGAYQFTQSAWNANAPAEYVGVNPINAPPAVQDQAARNYYVKSGWRPWPVCGRSLPDIYR